VIANITLVVASSLPCQLMATSAYAKKWEMGNVKLMMSGNAIGNGIAQPKNVSKNAQHAEDAKNAKIAAALVLRTLNYSHVDSRWLDLEWVDFLLSAQFQSRSSI